MARSSLLLLSPLLAASLRISPQACAPRTPSAVLVGHNWRVAAIRMADDDMPDPKPVINDAVDKMKKSVASVQENLSTLRVGRASPDILDRVEVNYFDCPTPLNQLASVTAPTATQLVIDPYDKSALGDIEKALYESDLGMTPNSDGKVIRLNVPQLTTDRRKELAKTAKSLGEDGKVAIRNVRKAALDKIKKMKKALGDDAAKDSEEEVQKAVKKYEGEVVKAVEDREKEILTL